MANNYAEKLKDPRWQKKRLEIFERDKWTCQYCSDAETTLVVHHRLYLSNTEPWEYPDELLVTLCEHCHDVEREDIPVSEKTLLQAIKRNFLSSDIARIANGFSKLELMHAPEVVASAYELALTNKEIQQYLISLMFTDAKERLKEGTNAEG